MVMSPPTAIGAALGLERRLDVPQLRSEATEHVLDHVVRPEAENPLADLGRQVAVSEVPGEARQLLWIPVTDLDDGLRGSLDPEPSPVVEEEPVTVRHGDGLRKLEQDDLAIVRGEAHAAAVTGIEIEGERPRGLFEWPVAGAAMNESAVHRHIRVST
jgi:hypothetical protein